jgi:hypothetical protein
MTFQICRDCGVGVHNECYGICGTAEVMRAQPQWRCLACRAVGTCVTMRDDDPDGFTDAAASIKRAILLTVAITDRPTECCLCSVDNGKEWMHAMHPMYDRAGRTARPLQLSPTRNYPKKRPAWAHTLCCYSLFTHPETSGCVYACFSDGSFQGNGGNQYADGDDDDDGENNEEKDDFPIHSSLLSKDPEDESVHHFSYSLPGIDKSRPMQKTTTKLQEWTTIHPPIWQPKPQDWTTIRPPTLPLPWIYFTDINLGQQRS